MLFFLLCTGTAIAQPLVLHGRVWCLNQLNANSTSGVENIVVVPGFLPQKSTLTVSNPRGYYQINTGIDLRKLEGKSIRLYVVSKCSQCGKSTNTVFVSADQANKRGTPAGHLAVDPWKINAVCTTVELDPLRAEGLLREFVQQPTEDLDKMTGATALVAPSSLLSLIAKVVAVVPAPNVGEFSAQRFLDSGKIKLGQALFASAMYQTSNMGFNFSPWRNLSEAVFYNPSALANSPAAGGISGFTNTRNLGKLSGFVSLSENLRLAAGGIYTRQNEFRAVDYNGQGFGLVIDSFLLDVTEYAAFLAPVLSVNDKLNVAVTAKYLRQAWNAPDSLFIRNPSGDVFTNEFRDQQTARSAFDADVSLTYNLHPSLQVGLNAMNVAGTKLHGRTFVAGEPTRRYVNQRAVGLGLCYRQKRLNIGADLLYANGELFDVAAGINYIPLNNILLSGGAAFRQGSYSLAARFKHFLVGYIYDNNWLVKEKRPGRSVFTQGRIYSGFSFLF